MDRVSEPDDPRRCQGSDQHGQCWNVQEPGSDYCRKHSGSNKLAPIELRQYQLTNARWRERMQQLADHEDIKSLREEIGLTRLMAETLFNGCKSETDLLASCGTFNTLVTTLERLIKTSHQIEQNLGLLLAKPTVILLGRDIVQIIIEELKGVQGYEDRVDRITDRMLVTIEQATNKTEE